MKLIGYYHEFGDEEFFRVYFTEDFSKLYYKDDDTEIQENISNDKFWNMIEENIKNKAYQEEEDDVAEGYGICCNSPWCGEAIHTDIYYRKDKNGYQIEKTLIVYDWIEAGILGFGKTKEEALKDLEQTEKQIQEHFNKENVRI